MKKQYENLDNEKTEKKRQEVYKEMNDLSQHRLLLEYMELYDQRNDALDKLISASQELLRYMELYEEAQKQIKELKGE